MVKHFCLSLSFEKWQKLPQTTNLSIWYFCKPSTHTLFCDQQIKQYEWKSIMLCNSGRHGCASFALYEVQAVWICKLQTHLKPTVSTSDLASGGSSTMARTSGGWGGVIGRRGGCLRLSFENDRKMPHPANFTQLNFRQGVCAHMIWHRRKLNDRLSYSVEFYRVM